MNCSLLIAIIAMALAATGGLAQYGRTPGGRSGGRQTMPPARTLPGDMPAANFEGIVRAVSSAKLTIELDDSNTMDFHMSKKTKFFDGSDRVKSAAVTTGLRVSVDARKGPDNSLDAMAVRLERSKANGDSGIPKP